MNKSKVLTGSPLALFLFVSLAVAADAPTTAPTSPGSSQPSESPQPFSAKVDAKGQPATQPTSPWVLQPAFSDEFNAPSLDLDKWDNHIPSWGLWSWEPDNVRVEGGLIKLRMDYKEHDRKGKKFFYTSGEIRSKAPPIRYGYFEARLKTAPLYPGVSPAFWLFRTEPDVWTEMDFELTQSPWVNVNGANCFVFRHPRLPPLPVDDKKPPTPPKKGPRIAEIGPWDMKADPRKGFHVYGIEWTPETIKWFCDGKQVRVRKNEYWDQPLDLIVSLGLRNPYAMKPKAEGFPTEFEVDYVRVWKRAGETSAKAATQPATSPANQFRQKNQ
ncbi:MAG: family 16 glycosylhydrolase [Planctomycetota bacterium]|nr:family 16 glycosylhydrolase [Planctomycetota bacterium]